VSLCEFKRVFVRSYLHNRISVTYRFRLCWTWSSNGFGDTLFSSTHTGRYLGEGFDDERLDTLFLTLPISWRGTLNQYAGRLHRIHESKKEVVIYDYVDFDVPVLVRMYDKRIRGYRSIGYEIEDD